MDPGLNSITQEFDLNIFFFKAKVRDTKFLRVAVALFNYAGETIFQPVVFLSFWSS